MLVHLETPKELRNLDLVHVPIRGFAFVMTNRKATYAAVTTGGLIAAALLAGASWAFEANQSGPAPRPAGSETPLTQNLERELGLTDPAAALSKPAPGTEVRIPGLGVIGVIPKMDFGLELLYGASEPPGKSLQLDDQQPGEFSVKGRVKRSF